jgi:hypothetical protein
MIPGTSGSVGSRIGQILTETILREKLRKLVFLMDPPAELEMELVVAPGASDSVVEPI